MFKKILLSLPILLLLIGGFAYSSFSPLLPIATGYAAKQMCSCHFIADRTQESIQQDDLESFPLNLTATTIDESNQSVRSTFFGMAEQRAVYRDNLGCVLLQGDDDYNVQLELPKFKRDISGDWPLGEQKTVNKVEGVDYQKLQEAIDDVFDPSLEMDSIRTRAVVVIYKDTLIAEKYAKGFDKDTEILGWSMNKSVVNALIGILVKEGKMNLEQDHLFAHWTDERSAITLNDMLQMQSGLDFKENYTTKSDATEMLFMSENAVEVASRPLLEVAPGTKWYYSSATSNALMGLVRKQFENHDDYLKFPHERLFQKIGMHSMVLEIDESGNYIGSSFGYATPRDWAKFGLLYLNEGNWYGEQIVDTSWVEFSRQVAEQSKGLYGGHFWHNHDHAKFKDVPTDLFYCSGFQGQYVYIFPSNDLVVVRMGLNEGEGYDANGFLKGVIEAVGD
ncbi:MAG: serine hydrolase domain-containing protein [Chitinophagales bacterium]